MHPRLIALAVLGWSLEACTDMPTSTSGAGDSPAAASSLEPSFVAATGGAPDIKGRFIVTLVPRSSPAAVAREHGVQPDFVYHHALNGFAGRISDLARSGLLRDNRVVQVEPDGIVTIVTTETNAPWGLDRLDQRRLPLSTTYTYISSGTGVTAYIIDTGIRLDHSQFGGRAVTGYDAVTAGGKAADCNGHGTHVAGTVGGATYGVAKKVRLVAVRVLNCVGEGTWSGVTAGIDWVTGSHSAGKPAVANMSFGGGANSSVDAALKRMIGDGVASAVAAGNGNASGIAQDACKSSPARVTAAMTIGATDKTDRKASWSNYGNCVDWFAPGVGIKSSWYTSATATRTLDGTSMATPHTTGVAALYLQGNPAATPQQVRDALFAATTKNIVTSSKTVNNDLLFTNY